MKNVAQSIYVHDRLSENEFIENEIFSRTFFYKMMFQGPKGYRKKYNKMAVLHFFGLIPLYSYLLSLPSPDIGLRYFFSFLNQSNKIVIHMEIVKSLPVGKWSGALEPWSYQIFSWRQCSQF